MNNYITYLNEQLRVFKGYQRQEDYWQQELDIANEILDWRNESIENSELI